VLCLLLVGLSRLEADTDYAAFFRQDTPVSRDYAALRGAGLPVNALSLVVRLPVDRDPLSPPVAATLARLSADLDAIPGVHTVLSPMTFAASPGGAATLVQAGFLSSDHHQIQMVLLTEGTSSSELLGLLDVVGTVEADGMTVTPTGTPYLWARMDSGVIQTQRESVLVVCVACLVFLLWVFRSVPLALLTLVVSMLPVALVLGLMGVLGLPVNIATVLIAGIAVGIAVDDTIYLVHTWQRLRQEGRDRRAAVDEAMHAVGGRMVATSVVLVGAFGVLGFSDFLPTAQFGVLSALVIVLALAADLSITPLVLRWDGPARRAA
jgi:predicted RND superfamily exporter protein